MSFLYHGSGFEQQELMSGFKRSGKLVRWDQTESNEFLYATTSREEAISQAFASMLEKHYGSERYKTNKKNIRVVLKQEHRPSRAELGRIGIYLYTIRHSAHDGWIKVNNEVNGLDNEYKTKKVIAANIVRVEAVNLEEWLDDKHLRITLEEFPVWAIW